MICYWTIKPYSVCGLCENILDQLRHCQIHAIRVLAESSSIFLRALCTWKQRSPRKTYYAEWTVTDSPASDEHYTLTLEMCTSTPTITTQRPCITMYSKTTREWLELDSAVIQDCDANTVFRQINYYKNTFQRAMLVAW